MCSPLQKNHLTIERFEDVAVLFLNVVDVNAIFEKSSIFHHVHLMNEFISLVEYVRSQFIVHRVNISPSFV